MNAKQFILGCTGLTAGIALMLLDHVNHKLLSSCGLTIMFVTAILSSSEKAAARCAPLVVLFLVCQMCLVVGDIHSSAPPDSGMYKPPTFLEIFMVTIWATCLCSVCWTYFRRRLPKDDDHAA